MSGSVQLAGALVLIAVAVSAGVGFAAIWSNPRRSLNRYFFSASIHVAVWLIVRYMASVERDLTLFRTTTAIGALMHFHLWMLKETVVVSSEPFGKKIRRGKWWLVAGLALSALCYTAWFIPTRTATEAERHVGLGFFIYGGGLCFLFVGLCVESIRQVRRLTGVQRIELQLLLIGGSATAILVVIFMLLRPVMEAEWMALLVPYIVLTFYASTVIAITTSRVFDARQLMMLLFHRLCLVASVGGLIIPLGMFIKRFASEYVVGLFVVLGSIWLAGVVRRKLDQKLQYYSRDGTARHAAISVAQNERDIEALERSFEKILRGWGQSDRSVLITSSKERRGTTGQLESSIHDIVATMRSLKWITPERLSRERYSNDRMAAESFLRERELGVLIIQEGLTSSLLVGVGVPATRQPYTYPQIKELMELASIMGSAIERAQFSLKVRHTEQLATVGLLGASLAHEIRNPLVSIKTFVQLLPKHYNDSAFRDKFFRLILDEVNRIDQLTDQLLDLASPRAYVAQNIQLHPILRSSIDLVAAKAGHKGITLVEELHARPDTVKTDSSAAKQVAINLLFNAIQAIENGNVAERWVRIATRNRMAGVELEISDSGPGISAEMMPRLFQPFQTTKSTGFGLGLAICSDILRSVNASISVDPPRVNSGATFRVTFPCQLS